MAEKIEATEVSFNAEIIAAALEAFEGGIPAVAAAALVNELPNGETVTANEGVESDRDVIFHDAEIMVEEKAMGVCSKEIAEQHAPAYIELESGECLCLNGAQVFENYVIPA